MKGRLLSLLFVVFPAVFPAAVAAADEILPPGIQLATGYGGDVDVTRYLVSEKFDGVRGRWTGTMLITRGGERIHAPAWFIEGWPNEPLDGELWMGRGRFDETSGVVRTLEPDHDAWREMKFMVFDLPESAAPFAERAEAIRALLNEHRVPWLQAVEQFCVRDVEELDAHLDRVVDAGGEGLMLHHEDARYRTGRNNHLMKYKPFDDAEARVVAHLEGKGKYEGKTGSLLVERPDGVRFRVGSGLSDAERSNPPPIGSWITYRYSGLTSTGLPRFPRFLRVREAGPPPN